jgi:beta-glucanase (GH16 family)
MKQAYLFILPLSWVRVFGLALLAIGLSACSQPVRAQGTPGKTTPMPTATSGLSYPTVAPFPTASPSAFPAPTASATTVPTPTATPEPLVTPTLSPTATPLLRPVGLSGSWRLIFHDEFNGTRLNTGKWATCYFNFTVGTNGCDHDQNELELYQPANASVSNGSLTLIAKAQIVHAANGKTYKYTSGMISTGPSCDGCASRFTFTYGYMEMRAWLPAGQGLWPAFWALPADESWPPEIDVFEVLGNQPNETNMTYHWPDGTDEGAQNGHAWDGPNFSTGWHTFAVDWEPNAITWYVDGIERFRYTNAKNIVSKPMYLVANLAVGGDWPGSPDTSTAFPALYRIDYIRVWQQ